MIAPVRDSVPPSDACPAWHADFLAMHPAILACARHAFRSLAAQPREEAIEEVVAAACVAYCRLAARGKAHRAFPTTLARYAIRHVRGGRRVGGRSSVKDVFSRHAQLKSGFRVRRLDLLDRDDAWREAVFQDAQTPVPEQAAFRVDFPRWLARHSRRDRGIALELAMGERTQDVAKAFHVTAGRVSQLRRKFHDSWQGFHGDDLAVEGR